MAHVLRMPGVAAGATDAVLAEWLVGEGAELAAGDAVATVETDKALVDIEAEHGGVLLRSLVAPGTRVDVGAPIAVLGDVGEQVADVDALVAELVGGAQPAEPSRLVSAPESRRVGSSRHEPGRHADRQNGRVFASPLARRLAAEAGIPLHRIDGTGPRRRVLKRDVERAVAEGATATSAAEPAASPAPAAPTTAAALAAPAAGEIVPHTTLRRAVARRLTQSKQEAPHFYVRATLPVDRLLDVREEVNAGREQRVSVNDLVVKAVAGAHLAVPEMNVTWGEDALTRHQRVDVAVAVATERGLVTPVVRDVPALTIAAVATQVRELAERARSGRLRQEELEGGTISVTNLGMHGVEEFAAIINPPHAAILAVGAVREEPVVDGGSIRVGRVMTVTLSVDHRPVDGVVAARWLAALSELVRHPVKILAS